MSEIKTKKKVMILRLEIDEPTSSLPFEIKLPANAKRVTGMMVTTTLKLWID
ncbi:hypothetical protein [Cytophaga hutchinsonii]|jgi:hypothetical protein|nr:hypothetical protein [Cytophaga hutchinsonii]SFX61044.1 hypothetical protein SAMN04487930_106142 [Cytophaga hutchinsonii ATCC 33406]